MSDSLARFGQGGAHESPAHGRTRTNRAHPGPSSLPLRCPELGSPLSLSLSISSIFPLSVATDLSPTMVCTNTASQIRFLQTHRRKRQHRSIQKFIISRLVALIRSALSLLWAQRKGWKIESFRRSKQTRAANYTCSPLALPLLAETLIGLTSLFTAILVSFLSDSSRSCKKTPAPSARKR